MAACPRHSEYLPGCMKCYEATWEEDNEIHRKAYQSEDPCAFGASTDDARCDMERHAVTLLVNGSDPRPLYIWLCGAHHKELKGHLVEGDFSIEVE